MPCSYTRDDDTPCQFFVPDDKLIQLQNTNWCKFHCPVEYKKNSNKKLSNPKANWDADTIKAFNQEIIALILDDGNNVRVNLSGVVFPSIFVLKNVDVTMQVDLTFAVFTRDVWFLNVNFSNTVTFDNAYFLGQTFFTDSHFCDYAYFNKAKFSGNANFSNVRFHGDAYFINTKFSRTAKFAKAEFVYTALFGKTIFSETANYKEAIFREGADFKEAKFMARAQFIKADFFLFAEFDGGDGAHNSTVNNSCFFNVSFSSAKFECRVSFSNREFKRKTEFQSVLFRFAPSFYNCKLHQDTNFADTTFNDTTHQDAARNYRTLKLAMEEHRARAEQTMFYALEQKSLRSQKDYPLNKYVLSLLYEYTSDYGRSFLLPLCILLYSIPLFYFAYNYQVNDGISPKYDSTIMVFSIKQTVLPFDAIRGRNGNNMSQIADSKYITTMQMTALFQSLISIAFIALAILAIRWEFRKG